MIPIICVHLCPKEKHGQNNFVHATLYIVNFQMEFLTVKTKKPVPSHKKKRAFTIWTSRFTSFTTKKFFWQNITGRSSDWRIILLVAPSPHQNAESGLATFVTDYSGGTVPFSPVKYSETTDFQRLHRKNLRNPCNLQLLLNWSWDSLFVPTGTLGHLYVGSIT